MDTFEDRIRAYWNTISSDEELWRNFVRDNLDDGARESQLFVAIFHFHSIPILAKLFQDAAVNASSESALLLRKVCDYRLFVDMEDEGWVFFKGIANLLLHNEEEARICCGPVREIIMATLKHKIPYDEFSSYVAHAILNEEGNYLARIDQIVMTMPDFFVDFVKSHLSLCYELDEKGFLSCFKKVLKEGFHLWPFLALMHLLANVLPLSPAGDEPMKDMLEAALSTDIFKDDLQTDSNSKVSIFLPLFTLVIAQFFEFRYHGQTYQFS